MDAMEVLANYVVQTKYEDLPRDVVERAKYFILDTFGVAIAGSTSPGTVEIIKLVQEWGGKPESTILMYGTKVPSYHAAFANSVLTHARELDDTHDVVRGHYNVSILPASLAVAEANVGVSGKDLITAVVLGIELMFRVGKGMPDYLGWHNTSTLGAFGAAAAAGKVLKLNPKQMLDCLGIVYSQIGGNHQCLVDGALTKRIQPAFSSMAGVRSAYLASRGIDGPRNVLEGKYGFYNVYGRGKYDREVIVNDLGGDYGIRTLSVKPFSSCRFTHPAIGAALDLMNEAPINPNDIDEVVFKATRLTLDLVGRPFEVGDNPEVSAQFSIPYTVATALLTRRVFIDDFTEASINRPEVRALTKRIRVEVDESIPNQILPVPLTMVIKLKNGQILSKEVRTIKGSHEEPLSQKELVNKFGQCMEYSLRPFSAKKIDQAVQLLSNLDEIENISTLTESLVA
jgi:2-methylcitrate dehydratase PrpD